MDAESEGQDVPWALFASDLKVNRMLITRPLPSLQFDIPIRPPLRFDPSKRPPPTVDLQLKKDTDAFIVDKVVLPLEPFTQLNDPRQRRVYYIVAWPDLRAARPVVDAVKILDYVSPRELEDWEYRDALRREKENSEAEAEAAASVKEGLVETGVAVARKKPGRKPKNAMRAQIRPPTPELDSEEEEILARKKQGPSLSTPQKSRIFRLERDLDPLDSEEASVVDADAHIQSQLESDAANQNFGDVYGEEERAFGIPYSNNPVSSSGASTPPSRPRSRSLNPSSFQKGSLSVKASPPPPAPQLKPKYPSGQATVKTSNQIPTSTTPIPLPFQLPFSPPQPKAPSSVQGTKVMPKDALASKVQVRSSALLSKPLLVTDVSRSGTNSSHSPTPESSGGFIPANSFTPVGGHFPRPLKRPASDSFEVGDSPEATPANPRSKKERRKKQPKLSQPTTESKGPGEMVLTAEPEPEYVVKRLEGDQILDGVHYFKVRWEGDWPPDQNPTWEPQDNISRTLVKKYLKRKAEREAAKPQAKTPKNKPSQVGQQQQTLAHWARNYASVSEAFEGKAELDHVTGLGNGTENGEADVDANRQPDDADNPDTMDELLVVDDSQARSQEESAADRARRLSAHVAAQFASLTPGRRTQF